MAKPRQRRKLVSVRSVVWYVGFNSVEIGFNFIIDAHVLWLSDCQFADEQAVAAVDQEFKYELNCGAFTKA
jgi:hypothetical protein